MSYAKDRRNFIIAFFILLVFFQLEYSTRLWLQDKLEKEIADLKLQVHTQNVSQDLINRSDLWLFNHAPGRQDRKKSYKKSYAKLFRPGIRKDIGFTTCNSTGCS